jgi:spore coat polysaccharide biosynthesis protein SpsF
MTDKVVAVVQARMGSTRLPNKAMLWLNGYPVIEWVRRRLEKCETLDDIVVALPLCGAENKMLARFLAKQGVDAVRVIGENNIIHRIMVAGETKQATHVVRVCGDCPLVAWEAVDELVSCYLAMGDVDYIYNHIPRGNLYPDGLGAEIVSMATLKRVEHYANTPEQREHAFNHIWDNLHLYRMTTFNPPDKRLHHPELKLDLDTYEDYQRLLASGVDIDMTAAEIVECFL